MAYPGPGARNQYLKTQVETATKEQLVVMLFDGIIRFTEQARKAIEEKQIEVSHNALMRAQAIIMELICTVDKDKGGKIASNLMGLHAYAFNCLIVCNMKKDVTKIDEVQNIYRELRDGWVGAMESLGIGSSTASAASPAAKAAATPAAAAPKAPLTAGPIPKAPAAAAFAPKAQPAAAPKAAPAASPAPAKPAIGPGSSGIMASAKPAAAPAASTMVNGYGLGKTAMMPGMARPVASAPAAAVPAPAVAAPASAAAKPVTSPLNSKQAAMLNAYQAASGGSRSIA